MTSAGPFWTALGWRMSTLDGVTHAVPRIRGSSLLCYPVDSITCTLFMTPRKTGFLPKRDAVSVITVTRWVGKAQIFSFNRTYFWARSKNCEKRLLASSCLSIHLYVRPSAWSNSIPTGQIFTKFDIRELLESLSRKFGLNYNLAWITGALREDRCISLNYS